MCPVDQWRTPRPVKLALLSLFMCFFHCGLRSVWVFTRPMKLAMMSAFHVCFFRCDLRI